ncbi:hypothetical protein V6R21_18945 [Limibacter armeniacum]|uniref:hypothetical protein n=1 Tax=Limibacter armeniacum TaxID=466084 RepID=UPI002FE50401
MENLMMNEEMGTTVLAPIRNRYFLCDSVYVFHKGMILQTLVSAIFLLDEETGQVGYSVYVGRQERIDVPESRVFGTVEELFDSIPKKTVSLG